VGQSCIEYTGAGTTELSVAASRLTAWACCEHGMMTGTGSASTTKFHPQTAILQHYELICMVGGIDRSRPVGPVHFKMVESPSKQTLDQPSPSSSPTLRHARGDRRSFLSRLRQRRGIQC
jgi:hypothetical protein